MLVVLTGFTSAGYLIFVSFQSWAVSPIKTTVETLPISEIKFPKVTVCPPKNTFTDLNYDLMLAEKLKLTNKMRNELIDYSEKVINEHTFTDDLNILQEDDRYYNWYYGYSKINRPYTNDNVDGRLQYDIETSAISGVVSTQYFGEQYQPSLVERHIYYDVNVYPPESARKSKNVTLHVYLEKVSITDLSEGYDSILVEQRVLEGWWTSVPVNFTPPASRPDFDYITVSLSRNANNEEDFTNIKMDVMPGFRLSWHYTGLVDNMTPDSRYSDNQENQLFIW